jgi:HEAT repeat protein
LALGTSAAQALPGLIEIAKTHPEQDGRYVAGATIGLLGKAAEPAIPFIIERLDDHALIIRNDAALALGHMRSQPSMVVPALANYAKAVAAANTNTAELQTAISALRRFGTNAHAALSIVRDLLEHPAFSVRISATNALERIDPSGGIVVPWDFMIERDERDESKQKELPTSP